MQMHARLSGLRNNERLPNFGPLVTRLSNLRFSIGSWKSRIGRADPLGPKSLETQALPFAHDGLRRASRPTRPGDSREPRPSLHSAPRGYHVVSVAREEDGRPHRTDPAAVKLWEAFDLPDGDQPARIAGPWPLSGQNCTVLLTDVVGFSSKTRNDEDRRIIRAALCRMTGTMLQGIADFWSEGRGDGMLTVVWPSIPTRTVIYRLREELLPVLRRHNSIHRDSARFQLRAAIGVGPLFSDAMGPSGDEITTIARLVDAPLFKKAMDMSGASLGVITTRFIYETVIKHDRNLTGYRQVQVDVKTFNGPAWMNVFSVPISPHTDVDPAVAC
jgi:hypothetical protein